jgi:hypothetical protein
MIENAPGVFVLRLNDTIKIGSARNMRLRVQQFRGKWWKDAELIAMIPRRDITAARRMERRLHRKFGAYAKGHEFFHAADYVITFCRRASAMLGRQYENDLGGGLRRRQAQLRRMGRESDERQFL